MPLFLEADFAASAGAPAFLQRDGDEPLPTVPRLELRPPSLLGPSTTPRYLLRPELELQLDEQTRELALGFVGNELDPARLRWSLSLADCAALAMPAATVGPFSAPLVPPPAPLVPAGAGPATPRSALAADLLRGVMAVPAIDEGLDRLSSAALDQVRHDWRALSTGERVGVVSGLVVIGAGTLAGIIANDESRAFALDQLNGRVLPVPGVPWLRMELNTGPDSLMIGTHVDVGMLLLRWQPSLGFGPASSPRPIGGPPGPEPFAPGAPLLRSPDQETPEPLAGLGRRISSAAGSGAPLDEPLRETLEGNLGADLASVRVHTGAEADRLSRAVSARAFTSGSDIFFRSGQYAPATDAGRRLIAHEAVHTVQQAAGQVAGSRVASGVLVSDPDDRFEREAERLAPDICQAGPPGRSPAVPLQRMPDGAPAAGQRLVQRQEDAGGAEAAVGRTRTLLHVNALLAHVPPLGEAERNTLLQAVPGAAIVALLRERDQKRERLADLRDQLTVVRPEHGVPAADSPVALRIASLEAEIESLGPQIEGLNGMIRSGMAALGVDSEEMLVDRVTQEFPRMFIARGKQLAIGELEQNRQIVEQEMDRYGVRACADPAERNGLMAAAADLVAREDELRELDTRIAGLRLAAEVPEYGVPDPSTVNSSYYDYQRAQERRDELGQALQQQRDGYALRYPVLMRITHPQELRILASGSEEEVNETISEPLSEIIEDIDDTVENIRDGDLRIWNLSDIVAATIEDLGIGDNPLLQDIVMEHIQGEETDAAILQIALAALAVTAGIVATVATGGLAAGAAVLALGAGGYQASASVRRYLAESAAGNVALDPRVADLSRNEPELGWLILDLVGVGLDALQVVRAVNSLRNVARVIRTAEELAEFGRQAARFAPQAAERLLARASRRFLRQAGEDLAMQVGMTMMADYFLGEGASEEDELSIEEAVLDLSSAAEAGESAGEPEAPVCQPLLLQRQPYGPPLPSWVPPALPSGAGFERSVEAMLRRGTVPGLPAMDSVIYGQYNPQGHGVDLFGIRIVGDRVHLYRIEVKGGRAPRLGTPASGTQMGRGWTLNAIDRMMENGRIRNLLMNRLGVTTDAQLRARLRRAPARVVVHASAFLGLLGRQVGGLRSRNRYAPTIHRVGRR